MAKNSCFLADFFPDGIGGFSPPLDGKRPKIFVKNGSKRVKTGGVFLPKIAVFLADFFLNGIGGTPPPELKFIVPKKA